jgi:hypothetical protein
MDESLILCLHFCPDEGAIDEAGAQDAVRRVATEE